MKKLIVLAVLAVMLAGCATYQAFRSWESESAVNRLIGIAVIATPVP
jgi:uncharacterized protein YcfL